MEGLLKHGYICESSSPCADLVLLVPKKDKSWHMCIDSWAINKTTVRYNFPVPWLDDMLENFCGALVFSKIDLWSGYHKICDEWKTAFKTRDRLYKWLVMSFDLSDAQSTFMNEALHSFIGICIVVYFDDILIYIRDASTYVEHLQNALTKLREEKLFANTSKGSFFVPKIIFLGYKVSGDRLTPDMSTIKAIKSWLGPTILFQIRSFHGLTSYYQRFIRNFRTIMVFSLDLCGR